MSREGNRSVKPNALSKYLTLVIFLVFMDAPVSGGVGAAAAGTLTFMVGGPAAEFEAGQSILQHMGAKIVACGDVGTGQGSTTAKTNNFLMFEFSR